MCKVFAGGCRSFLDGDDAPNEMGSGALSTDVQEPVRSNPGGSDAAWREMGSGTDSAHVDHPRRMDVRADLVGGSSAAQSCGRQGGEIQGIGEPLLFLFQ